MTTELALESGPEEAGAVCDCCGTRSTTVHGFVYKNGDAYAVYYAGWSHQHPERGVTMAIATGEWTEGSGPHDRVSIGLEARSTDADIEFTAIGPDASPWGETALFGKMLTRESALASSVLQSTLAIAELIAREDQRVHAVLWES